MVALSAVALLCVAVVTTGQEQACPQAAHSEKALLQTAASKAKTSSTASAPVCSSWQLRIAEDNPTGWEAHIFEIELFSGGNLISGTGKGTASSDCKHWAGSPEGAFDGDLSTKWVTCSGAGKVGKGITYTLSQPNAVTAMKTHQSVEQREQRHPKVRCLLLHR